MLVLLAILAPFLYIFISTITGFVNNFQEAKKTGLPYVISPISHFNPLWILLQHNLTPLLQRLPFGLGGWTRYNKFEWFFTDKYKMHEEYGKVFMHVTPGVNELHVADPAVNEQIFSKKRDFDKPPWILASTRMYGDSISNVNGAEWQKHRRITVPPFNERNSRLVWDGATRQALEMVETWAEAGLNGFSSVVDDSMTLALNVLAFAGLGKLWGFRESAGQAGDVHSMMFRDNLALLLESVEFIVLTPVWMYSVPFPIPGLSKGFREYLNAYKQFEKYMREMLDHKKTEVANGDVADSNLLTTLVMVSEGVGKDAKAAAGARTGSSGLSDPEILGNLFMYTFAGHETTAHTVGYALYLLAVFPEWQDWIYEEVNAVFGSQPAGELAYEAVYPQLKRCLAIMYETLRLYPSVLSINKATVTQTGQDLEIDGRLVHIPPNTYVKPNVMASQTLPEYWGTDHLVWCPDRWIASPQKQSHLIDEVLGAETFSKPPGGRETFIAWSDGARVCPGRKFSQVEFVAVISVLVRKHRIQVKTSSGESRTQARARAFEVVKDSMIGITLQMRNPRSVSFVLEARNVAEQSAGS